MRTARVFISSTFNDFTAERDALHALVFPRLERLCRENGCSFQAIDLRWGIAEEDGDDNATLDICLSEVRRCAQLTPRPNFIFLAGDRYGWRPLPTRIPHDLAERILTEATASERAALLEAYEADENAAQRELRLVSAANGSVLALLDAIACRMGLSGEEHVLLTGSATHRELLERLAFEDFPGSSVCAIRTLRNAPRSSWGTYFDLGVDGLRNEASLAEASQVKDLVRALAHDAYEYELDLAADAASQDAAMQAFAEAMYLRLEHYLHDEFSRVGSLGEEESAHRAYAEELHGSFASRSAEVEGLLSRIMGEDGMSSEPPDSGDVPSAPIVVVGDAGAGKTYLMAELAVRLGERLQSAPVARFIGLTAASSDVDRLLADLGPLDGATPLVVDGVDHANKPRRLVEGLLSAGREGPLILSMDEACRELCARYLPADARVIRLEAPTKAQVSTMVDARLAHLGRRATWRQKGALLDGFERTGDMHLVSMLTERVATLASFADASSLIGYGSVGDYVRRSLLSLTRDQHFGQRIVEGMVAFLLASRAGLSDKELYDLLSRDQAVWAELEAGSKHTLPDRSHGLPYAYFSRVFYALLPLLVERRSEGEVVYRFAPGAVEDAARAFVQDSDLVARHSALADYFLSGRTDFLKGALAQLLAQAMDAGSVTFASRFTFELPGQLVAAGRYEELYGLLRDQTFLAYLHAWGFEEYVGYWARVEEHTTHTIAEGFSEVLGRARAVVESGGSLSDADQSTALYLSDLLGARGGNAEALSILSQARMGSADAGSTEEVQAWYHQAQSLLDTGHSQEALTMAKERFQTCPKRPGTELCYVLYVLGQGLFRTDAYVEAEEAFRSYLDAAKAVGDRSQAFIALKWVASCEKAQNHQDEAMAIYRQLEDEYGEDGNLSDLVPLYFEIATSTLLSTGDSSRAMEYFDRCEGLCTRLGNLTWLMQLYQTQMFMANVTRNDQLAFGLFPRYVEAAMASNQDYQLDTTHFETYLIALVRLREKRHPGLPDDLAVLRMAETYAFLERCGNLTPELVRQSARPGQAVELCLKAWELALSSLPECLQKLVANRPADPTFFLEKLSEALAELFPRWDVRTYEPQVMALNQGQLPADEVAGVERVVSAVAFGMAYAYPVFDHIFEMNGEDGAGCACNLAKVILIELGNVQGRLRNEVTFNEYAYRVGTYQKDLRQLRDQFDAMASERLAGESEAVRSLYQFFSNRSDS